MTDRAFKILGKTAIALAVISTMLLVATSMGLWVELTIPEGIAMAILVGSAINLTGWVFK